MCTKGSIEMRGGLHSCTGTNLNALLTWLLLCEVTILWQCVEESRGLSEEGEALYKFGSNGSLYTQTALWESWDVTDENPCAWAGVACTANSSVERLDLSGWGLSGYLDIGEEQLRSFAGVLKSLKELDMSSNQLGGRIPAVNSFKGLTVLDLSGNNFSGEIPSTLGELRNLRYLSLERNRLNGSVPRLEGLADLRFVSLSGNQLSGAIPEMSLWDLRSLRGLDLSGNNLSGPIPNLGSLPNLLTLDLSNNSLIGCVPSLATVPKLQNLYLAHNRLSSVGCPGGVGDEDTLRASLRRVDVSHNVLEGYIPQGFVGVVGLEYLDLSDNNLEGGIPPWIPSNTTTWIDLSRNRLSGNIPPDMLNWRRSSDDVSGIGRPGQGGFMTAAWEKTLNLSHNRLGGSIPGGAGVLDIEFDVLDLSQNELQGLIPPISAHVLWLGGNRLLIGDIKDSLGRGGTRELRLDGNGFSGGVNLKTLLDVGGNLEVLDLSHNLVRWATEEQASSYPEMILEGLVALRELRLGGNRFMGGSLPTLGLGRILERLEVLDLSGTGLDGHIPAQVVNSTCFPRLRLLNLSDNALRGAVPASIAHMPSLTLLALSDNRLSGPLPDGLPPALLQKSFFANNPGLCGFPLPACRKFPYNVTGVLLLVFMLLISLGSCMFAGWLWRNFKKRHQQDADLIATLLDRETVATLMPLWKLKKATSNFSQASQIGVGGFGTVYKGKLSDGTTVAIKKSKPWPEESAEHGKRQFLNEVRILSLVNHQNLVKLLGCCLENKQSVLVLEYVSNGTLQEHLRRGSAADAGETAPTSVLLWKQRLHIAAQTADALAYLHSAADPPIFHRDLKSANILLDDRLNAKVADFGISKVAPVDATHVSTAAIRGTWGYIDPEYFNTRQLTSKSDVYSFGVVLLELISAQPAIRVDVSQEDEDASLVTWARERIDSGDLHHILDPTLEERYGFAAGKESIEKLGRLALTCLAPMSKDRLTMREVCTELRCLLEEAPEDTVLVSTVNGDMLSGMDDRHLDMSVYYTANLPGPTIAQVY